MNVPANIGGEGVELKELVKLCALDSELFCKTFFPKAFRQAPPLFYREFWETLEGPQRLVNIQMARGFSKTTRLRAYTAKRIAYGISRTVLYIGKSEGHAIRSIKWIKQAVEFNKMFGRVFGLQRGTRWSDIECQILHGIEQHPVWLMGMGITGSVRGINQEDFRPDLIVIDDVCDEENSATAEQRQKIEDLVYGALMESLAPRSEAPESKMVMLQTPLNREDISMKALVDPSWSSMTFGCWTKETANLPSIDDQKSSWPARWPDQEVREEKRAAIRRNKLSVFIREKECRITSPETSSFKPEWLKRWSVLPPVMTCLLAIDPVPPPSDLQVKKGLSKKDYEAFAVVGIYGGNFYVRAIRMNRGHEPNWTINTFITLATDFKIRQAILEAVAYQRTLKWILSQAMAQERRYWRVEAYVDARSKFSRIVDGLSGPASEGKLYIPPDTHPEGIANSEGMAAFATQFLEYPGVAHEDALEAVAVALAKLNGTMVSENEDNPPDEEDEDWKPLVRDREVLCP